MRLLLDENLPRGLVLHIPGHEVYKVPQMGWQSKKNDELLKLMLEAHFEAFITVDKGIEFQQNFKSYPLPVLVLRSRSNRLADLLAFIPSILELLRLPLSIGVRQVFPE